MKNVADIAAGMSDRELYSYFSEEKFYVDPELSQAVCQEVENREAALAGRQPAKVYFDFLDCAGVSGMGRIGINVMYLQPDPKWTPADLLNTILHEGRHEWQYWVRLNHPEDLPEKTRLLFAVSDTCYQGGNIAGALEVGISDKEAQADIEYGMQENEIDARFYAYCKMKELASEYNLTDVYREAIDKAMDEELYYMDLLRYNMGEEEYQLLEKLIMELYKVEEDGSLYCPVIPEGFRCYENIWMVQNIVYPALEMVEDLAEELFTLDADRLLFTLYEEARMNFMSGKPLESPEKLVSIMLSDESFRAEFRINDQGISGDLKAKIRM